MKNNRGFSLIEMMVASTIVLIIAGSIYLLVITTQSTYVTEGRKLDMNQAARSLEHLLYDNIRSAGSVLALLPTPAFLGSTAPFTGIYPLNNGNYPDGIILASGDSYANTKLSADYTPPATTVNVITTEDPSGNKVWANGDIGIIIKSNGYYVFKVQEDGGTVIGSTTLPIRANAIYYSGLLNVAGPSGTLYDDLTEDQNDGTYGNGETFPAGTPVIRLTYFNIYLVKTENDGSRTLTLTTDCGSGGMQADPLANPDFSSGRAVPIVSNIEDIQFEYITKGATPEYWASISTEGTSYSNPCPGGNCENFINQFLTKNISAVRVHVLFKTEEEKNKRRGSGIVFKKPVMGDIAEVTLPKARYHYTYMKYEIFIRNYNMIF